MKKFIVKIFTFVILLISFAYFFEYVITSGLKKMSDYRFKTWTDFTKSQVNADLIINGNSRAFSHYSPDVLDSALAINSYNLGIGGYPFETQYLKYHFYLQYNNKPRFIIQNVDFITLKNVEYIGFEREQFFPYVFTPFMRVNLSKYGFTKSELYLPLVRYFGYQQEIKEGLFSYLNLFHKVRRTTNKGYSPETGKWNPEELNKLDKLIFEKDVRSTKLFERFLAECHKDSILVFLVNSPVYYRATAKLLESENMKYFFLNKAKKYNAEYLDYTNNQICFDSTNFVVSVHMNESASRKFSRILASDIDSICKHRNYNK